MPSPKPEVISLRELSAGRSMSHAAEEYAEDRVDEFLEEHDSYLSQNHDKSTPPLKYARQRLWTSFFCFGLLNNVLYVIILSAALDLVPASTPKGIVAFFNIFPALIAKAVWPYVSKGEIRYRKRVYWCTACSWTGMIVIAMFNSTAMRLIGIGIASFSSGLGELTFLQWSTVLPTASLSGTAVGGWSSGTGAAGLVGAGLWWSLRNLGVRLGLGLASILPIGFPAVLNLLLPPFESLGKLEVDHYEPIFAADDDASEVSIPRQSEEYGSEYHPRKLDLPTEVILTTQEKIELVKPLVMRYMFWIFAVYVFEYVINTGITPVLAFPPPTTGAWRKVFKTTRDYYPFWALTYQSFVFLSRSSLSLGVPPIPRLLLPLPAILQGVILGLLTIQAKFYAFSSPEFKPHRVWHTEAAETWWHWVTHPFTTSTAGHRVETIGMAKEGSDRAITIVFLLICLEGLMGGAAYCMTFYHIGREGDEEPDNAKRRVQKAFRMGACGSADTLGVCIASLISMPVEISLCNAQAKLGSSICKSL